MTAEKEGTEQKFVSGSSRLISTSAVGRRGVYSLREGKSCKPGMVLTKLLFKDKAGTERRPRTHDRPLLFFFLPELGLFPHCIFINLPQLAEALAQTCP